MPKLKQDLVGENALVAGDGYSFEIEISDPNVGPAAAITEARWGLSAEPGGAPAVTLTKTGGAIVVSDLAVGIKLTITVPGSASAALAEGRYYHEAEIAEGGDPITVTKGLIEVLPQILA